MPGETWVCGRMRVGQADGLEYAHHFVVEMDGARQVIDVGFALEHERPRARNRPSRLASVAPTGP